MEKKFDTWKRSLKRTFGRKAEKDVAAELQKAEEADKPHALQQQPKQRQQQQVQAVQDAEDLLARPTKSGSWLKRTFRRRVEQQVQAELRTADEDKQHHQQQEQQPQQQQDEQGVEGLQAGLSPILVPPMERLSHEQAAAFAAPAVIRATASEETQTHSLCLPSLIHPLEDLQAVAARAGLETQDENDTSPQLSRYRVRTQNPWAGLSGFRRWASYPLRTTAQLDRVSIPEANELERWEYHHVLSDMVTLTSVRMDGAAAGAVQGSDTGSAVHSTQQSSAVQSTYGTQSSVVELNSLDPSSTPQEPSPSRASGRFATWSCCPSRGSGNVSSSPPAPPRPQIPVPPVQESEDLQPAPLQTDVADGRGPSAETPDQDAEDVQGEERGGRGAEAEGAEDLPAEALQPHVSAISSIQTARRAHPLCNASSVVEDLRGSYRHNPLPRRVMTHEQAQEKLRQVRARINALQRAAPAVAEGRRGAGEEMQQELGSRVVEGLQAEREEEEPLERTELSATLEEEETRQVMLDGVRGSALVTQGQAREEQTTSTAQLARKPTDALCGDTEDDAGHTERARSPELGEPSSPPPEATQDLPATQTSMGPEPGVWFSSSSSSRPRNTRVDPDNAPGTPEAFTAAVNTAVAESGFNDEQVLPRESRGEVSTPSSLGTPSRLQTMHSSPARGRHGNRDSSSVRDDPEARARSVRQWFIERERRNKVNGVVDGPSVLDDVKTGDALNASNTLLRPRVPVHEEKGESSASAPNRSKIFEGVDTSISRAGPSRPRLVLRSRHRIRGSATCEPHEGRVEDGAGTSSSQDEDRPLSQTGTLAESGQAEPASVRTAMRRSEDAEDLQAGPADKEESDEGSVGRASMEVVARSSMESVVTTIYRGPDT